MFILMATSIERHRSATIATNSYVAPYNDYIIISYMCSVVNHSSGGKTMIIRPSYTVLV